MAPTGPIELRRTPEVGGWMKIHLALGEDQPDVSRLWAPTFDMRIGSALVKMGGIAGVGTDEAHRMRGYSRLVLEESTRYFAETGHDVAVLFGIPDFYHRFGYAPVLPVTTLTVTVEDALAAVSDGEREAFAAGAPSGRLAPTADEQLPPAPVRQIRARPIVPGERQFRDGDRVQHSKWGSGIVVTSRLTRDDEEVTVAFHDASVGRRTLLASLANLELTG